MDADRPVEVLGDRSLVGRAEVTAPLERQALFLEQLRRIVVREAWEGCPYVLKLRGVSFEYFELRLTPLQNPLDDVRDEPLGEIHDVVERRIRHFRFDHPELGQVTSCLGFL